MNILLPFSSGIGVLLLLCGHLLQLASANPARQRQCRSWYGILRDGQLGDGSSGTCPTLLNDEAEVWDPWSRRPFCNRPMNINRVKFCVYSYPYYRGESSISVVTVPDLAGSMETMIEVEGSPAKPQGAFPPSYEVRDLPGKGKGVIANATIKAGDLIMAEYPVLVDVLDDSSVIVADRHEELLREAFERLAPADQKRVLALSRIDRGGYIVQEIMNTNIFGINLRDIDHSGLYPAISRINHACRPNALSQVSRATLRMEIRAYRDIQPGEELSLSYTPINMLYADRQTVLNGWGFNCTCTLCASKEESEISDTNRKRIQEILQELDITELRSENLVAELVEEVLDLVEAEGMQAQVGDLYGTLAQVYLEMEHHEKAREYGELAIEKLIRYAGKDSKRTAEAETWLQSMSGK